MSQACGQCCLRIVVRMLLSRNNSDWTLHDANTGTALGRERTMYKDDFAKIFRVDDTRYEDCLASESVFD